MRGFRFLSAILTSAMLLTSGLFLTTPSPEAASGVPVLFGAIGNHIVTVNQGTGEAEELGTTPSYSGLEAMTYHADRGTMYGIVDGATDPKLARIDRGSGQATVIGPIDIASPFLDLHLAEALAFNPADGKLYAAGSEFGVPQGASKSDRLVTVDPATGSATMIAFFSGVEEADAMDFAGGTLYVSNTAPPQTFLYAVDPATAIATLIGEVGFNHVADVAYNADTDVLYGTAHTDRLLIRISRTTGQGTEVGTTHGPGDFGGATLTALAAAPAVTEEDCTYEIIQGSNDYFVQPFGQSQNVVSFYDYRSASAHTPFVEAYASVFLLYVDTGSGNLYLVFHFNIDNGGTPDAETTVGITGIPSGATVALSDDPGAGAGAEFFIGRFPQGQFRFFTNTDGGILGPLPTTGTWSMDVDVSHFGPNPIQSQKWVDRDTTRLPLALQGTITIKSVCNQAPTGDPGGPYSAVEGSPITFDAGASGDPDGDALTYRWDFQTDGTWDTAFSSDPTATFTFGDDWSGFATVEVSDGNLKDDATVPVTITNVDPTIQFVMVPSGDEAGSLAVSAHVTDPGSDDLSFTWWGACSGWPGAPVFYPNDPAIVPDPDPSPDVHPRDVTDSQTVVCGDDGTFDWNLKVEDDDGGMATSSGTFGVANLAPSLTLPPPTFVNTDEGVAWTLTATAEDAGSDDLTFTWTWPFGPTETNTHYNDAVGPDPDPSPGPTFPFSATDASTHTYGDDGTYTVTLRVEDDDGAFLTVTTTFSTANLPPSLTVSPPSSTTVDEGTLVTLSATAKDPGSDDLTFTWTWTHGPTETTTYFNDGVGPDPDPSPGATFPFTATDASSRTYGDDCPCVVQLRVEDDDGGYVTFETSVTVLNVDPSVLAADASGDEAETIAFAATFSDPGFDFGAGDSREDFTATVDWGDGSSESVAVSEIAGGPGVLTTGSLAADHVYGDNGAFPVLVTVCDDDGGCGIVFATITVLNLAPAPSIDAATQQDSHLPAGRFHPLDPIAFNSSGLDAGSDDLVFAWDFGDGTVLPRGTYFNDGVGPDPLPSPGPTYPFAAKDTVEHTYALPGDYVVTLTVTDDDGGTAQAQLTIHVTSPADLKDESIQRIRALKEKALDRQDWKFVQNLDDAERFVLRSLGYADPFRPASITVELGANVSVSRNEGDEVDLTVQGPFLKDALLVAWDNGVVTTVDLPDNWPKKSLHYDDTVWVDLWEQHLAVDSKFSKKAGTVTLQVHVDDARMGFSLSLDADFVAHLSFDYEVLPYWIDGAHLDPKLGANVFVCEAAAVDRLVKLQVLDGDDEDDDDDDDDDDDGGDDDGNRDGDRSGDRVLGGDHDGGDDDDDDDDDDDEGDDHDDEDGDDRKVGCGCGGDDKDDGCGDDDDDGGDDDGDRDGDRSGSGTLGSDHDGGDDDDGDEDDKGCRCGDDDDDDDDDESDEDVRTVHCRLTSRLWTDAERAALDAECDAIANLLVKADEMLARIALEEAKETPVRDPASQVKFDREIAKSERSLPEADEEWDLLEYGDAICQFMQAWQHAQHAIKLAET